MRALAMIVIFGVSATFAFGDHEDVKQQQNPWRPGKKDETHWLGDQLPDIENAKRQKGRWRPGKKDETNLFENQLNDLQAPETVKRQTPWRPGKKDETHWLGNHNAQASTGSMQSLNDGEQNDPETQITGMGGVSPPAAHIPFPRPGRKRRSMTA